MELVWIIKAKYIADYKVEITFNDGLSGIVDLKNHLEGDVYKPLKNVEFFRKIELDSWTLTWPNDSDFSPEFLYDLTIKQKEEAHSI